MDENEAERKVLFYERVYLPYLRNTFEDFIDELGNQAIWFDSGEKGQKALELLGNMAVLLREPRILDSHGKECH